MSEASKGRKGQVMKIAEVEVKMLRFQQVPHEM
jgi:hypothetical protein